ncbi:hypothetical protein B0I35DRAFT_356108 [Stachybotrys elegans]|uniref:HECT-type E3 ubiquitin transferase n=1 Tax=Stachybotrys elegans TaxID=80388 RepID=A0A8K0WND6_9HYPO|nr:hypothetical protein B0I35DRAFT_356108 [Stachybotrys elegans]
MTSQSPYREGCGRSAEVDKLLAGLWQEAPFPRLPADAPRQLFEHVKNIEDPRHVYAVHRATRRHDFQTLVDKYMVQLRIGCEDPSCITPTCFTCRRRLARKAPIRRYNMTSARTLAVFLASQDNPERGLCPSIRRSRMSHNAASTLRFTLTRPLSHPSRSQGGSPHGSDDCANESKTDVVSGSVPATAADTQTPSREPGKHPLPPLNHGPAALGVEAKESSTNSDHRSFSANIFATAPFKLLGWLTPQSIESIYSQISELRLQSATKEPHTKSTVNEAVVHDKNNMYTASGPSTMSRGSDSLSYRCTNDLSSETSASDLIVSTKPTKPKQNPTATFRTSSSSRNTRKGSMEPLSPTARPEIRPETRPDPKLPHLGGLSHDKILRASKNAGAVIGRGIPEIPAKPAFFGGLFDSPSTTLHTIDPTWPSQENSAANEDKEHIAKGDRGDREQPTTEPASGTLSSEPPSSLTDFPPPQTLRQLNIDLIDFICDTLQADGTLEMLIFDTLPPHPCPQNRGPRLERQQRTDRRPVAKKQWKTFNEQALFSVLSDPRSLILSFTKDGKLFDSHTLWYCMLRMTRVAPTVVFHSLWLAAGSLFVPSASPADSPHTGHKRKPLSSFHAGCIMSICLHALVAAASIARDSRSLYEMSRIRSNGLTLASSSGAARQPASICLQYDDVFSNVPAARLARRLFRAVAAHRHPAKPSGSNETRKATPTVDILQPLLNQLDLLSPDSERILDFAETERSLHEARVPTLLLDWARSVLLNEWDGCPEYACGGPFDGALSLISSMYHDRNVLLLGDIQFRIDYFAERLDMVETPVDWVSFKSTRKRKHIMDHPYLFNPETLVSFFRAINFSRMSRMFEESSSLKTRMTAIVDPGSLITNPHHKVVLQDMLKKASSKYLVLQVGRRTVLRDAFDQLWRRERRELLRPLKVHLGEDSGEEGFDSGGVQQEFFRMAIAECLDPAHGAFTVDDRTRMAWFQPGSVVESWKFELMGLLVSLAIYNGLTLPVTFPRALYRKLLGEPVEEIYHIKDGWPALAEGLTYLVDWDEKDGSVEDVFSRTYEFSVELFGDHVTREMTNDNPSWPQGLTDANKVSASGGEDEAPMVTGGNRDQYVMDYIRYLTDVSVRPQYLAFERGFRTCLEPKSLTLLSPFLLQSIVEGIQEIDISELRRYARYVGWDASHRTVKEFWSIVKRYDDRMKRKLLEFVTASDRVPVGGMRNLHFVIQKNGESGEGGRLPTAYTCYGTLLLPEYRDKEVLRERLGMALENAQGFGFA